MTILGEPAQDPHMMSKALPVFGLVVGAVFGINGLFF